MSSVKTTQLDGDVSVGRNTSIGGNIIIQGGGHVKGTLVIDGWLDAKNIKGSNKGIFTTAEKLREAYPRPHDGWWAIVGNTIPSPIYVGDGGEWVATGESGGTPTLEDTNGTLQQAIDDAKNKANEVKKVIEDMVKELPIAQELGESATSVMSQAAVTKALKGTRITTDDGKSLQEVYDIARRAKQMIRLDASLISGGYIKTNGTTTDYSVINDRVYSYVVKDVVEGDTFLIQGKSGSVGTLFAFVDASGNILSRSDVSNSVKNYEAVAPQGATKIIIQGDPSTTHVFMELTKGYELYDAIKSSLIESQRYTFSKGFVHSSGTIRTSNNIPLCVSGFIKIPRWAKKIAVTIAKSQYMLNQTGLGFFNGNRSSIDVKVYPYGINQSVMTVYDIPTNAEYLRATFFDGIPNIGRFELYFINDENEEQIRCLVDRYNAVHVRSRDIFIAASDATDQEKEIAHYVCDGTKDTDVIQEVINLLMQSSFKGGCIKLSSGHFYISKFNDTSNGGRIFHDALWINGGADFSLRIEGAYSAAVKNPTGNGTFIELKKELYDNLNSDDSYNIVRCYVGGYFGGIEIENVNFIIPNNQKKIVCFNSLEWTGHIRVRSCQALTSYGTQEPANIAVDGCIGFLTGTGVPNGSFGQDFDNCTAQGFYEGFAINAEWSKYVHCSAIYCVYPFTFSHYDHGAKHPMVMINCGAERNINGMRFFSNINKPSISIIAMDFECYPSGAYKLQQYATEEVQGQWYGQISYASTSGGASANTPTKFWEEDGSGKNIKTIDLTQKQVATKAEIQSYPANYNQVVYCTDLNLPLICTEPSTKVWRDFAGNVRYSLTVGWK